MIKTSSTLAQPLRTNVQTTDAKTGTPPAHIVPSAPPFAGPPHSPEPPAGTPKPTFNDTAAVVPHPTLLQDAQGHPVAMTQSLNSDQAPHDALTTDAKTGTPPAHIVPSAPPFAGPPHSPEPPAGTPKPTFNDAAAPHVSILHDNHSQSAATTQSLGSDQVSNDVAKTSLNLHDLVDHSASANHAPVAMNNLSNADIMNSIFDSVLEHHVTNGQ